MLGKLLFRLVPLSVSLFPMSDVVGMSGVPPLIRYSPWWLPQIVIPDAAVEPLHIVVDVGRVYPRTAVGLLCYSIL